MELYTHFNIYIRINVWQYIKHIKMLIHFNYIGYNENNKLNINTLNNAYDIWISNVKIYMMQLFIDKQRTMNVVDERRKCVKNNSRTINWISIDCLSTSSFKYSMYYVAMPWYVCHSAISIEIQPLTNVVKIPLTNVVLVYVNRYQIDYTRWMGDPVLK